MICRRRLAHTPLATTAAWSLHNKKRAPIDGSSRGGLTSKIHAVVDSNGLPVRLALSPGEAHGVRLAGKLLSRLNLGQCYLPTAAMTPTGSGSLP